jgi:protein-disulfide isomerase
MSASGSRKSETRGPGTSRRGIALIAGGVIVATALVSAIAYVNRSPAPSVGATAAAATADVGRTLGAADAAVTLEVWTDFQCPTCRIFNQRMKPFLVEEYVKTGKARFVHHDMAFIGDESLGAAISARCAERQGQFWTYVDLLFANQGGNNSGAFSRDQTTQFAARVPLDIPAFSACLDDPAIERAVKVETRQAYEKGVKETPTLLVNGIKVTPVNDWPSVSAAINSALKNPTHAAP